MPMKFVLRLLAVVTLLLTSAYAQQAPRLDPRKVNIDRMLIDPYSYWNQPYSFYYFRHMDEVEGLRIDWLRRPNRPYALAKSTATLAPTYTIDGTTHALDDYLTKADVIAFVVLKDNQIVYEKYLHDARPADRFISF